MIAHIRGRLLEKHPTHLIVDVGGVGYQLAVPLSTFYDVGEPGAEVALRVHTHVREDALLLFGFLTALERDLFERLIAVSGVGPRLALAVLSGIEPQGLVRAVRDGDVARLTAIPGIGRKTAERVVLELRDRLPKMLTAEPAIEPATGRLRDDLLSALLNLGYHRPLAEKAVDGALAAQPDVTFETALRAALLRLAK